MKIICRKNGNDNLWGIIRWFTNQYKHYFIHSSYICKVLHCKVEQQNVYILYTTADHETWCHLLTPADKESSAGSIHAYLCSKQKWKEMEVISIEAGTFEEMKQALSSIIRNIRDQKGKRPEDSLEGWTDNQEACIMMDISPRKLLSLRSTGKIPYSKIDRKIYYRKKDIVTYMEGVLQKGNN